MKKGSVFHHNPEGIILSPKEKGFMLNGVLITDWMEEKVKDLNEILGKVKLECLKSSWFLPKSSYINL